MTGCALQDHTPVRLLTSPPTVSYPQQMLWPLWPAGHSWGELYPVTPPYLHSHWPLSGECPSPPPLRLEILPSGASPRLQN